jgi:cobalt-zinc-cadmium efflux system outer membrane protein
MKNQNTFFFVVLALCWGTSLSPNAMAQSASAVENLTLEQALDMAENLQPQIAEAKALVEAAEGRARQAGAFPNPEVIAGAQQLPLSGNQPNEKEYLAGLGQTVPLSGRLGKARQAELLEKEVRARGLDVKRREIRKRVHNAFATALYQEKAYQAQKDILQNVEKGLAATRARVDAGDALKEELARAEIELARAKVEWQRTVSLRAQALVGLVAAIGDTSLNVKSLAGTMEATFDLPALDSLVENLPAQPGSALADADIRARMARVDLAKAERIPDVKVEVLYHRLEATSANTVDMGLSIPLPLFNRNQGKLREARAEQAAAEARARMTQTELSTQLRQSYLQLTAALANRQTFKTEILGKAETILQAAEARYAAGDISLAELLPVRRDWAAVQLSYLESLRDVMQAWGEVKGFEIRPDRQ